MLMAALLRSEAVAGYFRCGLCVCGEGRVRCVSAIAGRSLHLQKTQLTNRSTQHKLQPVCWLRWSSGAASQQP